jgi:chaperone BCS1
MPGHGMHMFVEDGVRYWLEHGLEDQGVAGKQSVLTIKTIGKGGQPLRNLIDLAVEMANEENRDKNVTYVNDENGWWSKVRLSPLRSSSSLFLKEGLFTEILADSRRFLDGEAWYQKRGLPYRRGYLLHGPAGNGKSTVVQVLATELNLPIYMLGLTEPELTDNGLARALGRTPERCLLVVEDFEKIDLSATDVTMSGLLNAIDGALASEGRLLIMTANEPESISEYFLRPGRVDRRWEIGHPDADTIELCMARFSLDGQPIGPVSEILSQAKLGKWSMARVQQELLAASGMGENGQYVEAGIPDPEPEPVKRVRASSKSRNCNCGPDGGCDQCTKPGAS